MVRKLSLVGVWVFVLFLGALFLSPLRKHPPHDFAQFYCAGKLAAAGRISELYHKPAYHDLVRQIQSEGDPLSWWDAFYFNRPAFDAFLWIPVAGLSYRHAVVVGIAANLLLLAILAWKLPVWFEAERSVRIWLVGFVPFLWSIGLGQDTLLLTLILAYGLRLALAGEDVLAGIVLAACAFKPHLIWALPLAMLAAGKRKMLGSFLAMGGLLAAVSFAAVGPAGIREWVAMLQSPTTDALPDRMGNVRAMGLHFGSTAGIIAAAAAVAALGAALWKGSATQKFSAALIASLLLSPHTYGQDFATLAIVGMFAGHWLARYLLLAPWVLFYPGKDLMPLAWVALAYLVYLGFTSLLPAGSELADQSASGLESKKNRDPLCSTT